MKKVFSILILATMVLSSQAFARDTKHLFSIKEAMESADFKEKLDPTIRFIFGQPADTKVLEDKGNFVSNKKTNAFNKTDKEACEWVLLSALLSFQDRVRSEGGNAVINIESYYKKNAFISTSEYECHAGAIIAGVALKGDVVKLAE
ncbi:MULTISPECIES: hypothetical protein [Methylophaga]|nr:hypothetical protein [Methylophaga marina]